MTCFSSQIPMHKIICILFPQLTCLARASIYLFSPLGLTSAWFYQLLSFIQSNFYESFKQVKVITATFLTKTTLILMIKKISILSVVRLDLFFFWCNSCCFGLSNLFYLSKLWLKVCHLSHFAPFFSSFVTLVHHKLTSCWPINLARMFCNAEPVWSLSQDAVFSSLLHVQATKVKIWKICVDLFIMWVTSSVRLTNTQGCSSLVILCAPIGFLLNVILFYSFISRSDRKHVRSLKQDEDLNTCGPQTWHTNVKHLVFQSKQTSNTSNRQEKKASC